MNFGILPQEPFATYLTADAIGSGSLDDLHPRPLVFYRRWIARNLPRRPSTAAFDFGRLFHCLALEGEDAFKARYVTVPPSAPADLRRFRDAAKPSTATRDSIAYWDKFEADSAGKERAADSDLSLAWRMVESIRAKPAAAAMLDRGLPEVTFRHQLASFAVQARVDWFDKDDPAGPLLVNVKTIESLDDFDQQYERFMYYKGDAFYRLVVARVMGIEASRLQSVCLVVEKQEPFECSLRAGDPEALRIGTEEVMADLRLIGECFENNRWPGEPADIRPVSLSEWKRRTAA